MKTKKTKGKYFMVVYVAGKGRAYRIGNLLVYFDQGEFVFSVAIRELKAATLSDVVIMNYFEISDADAKHCMKVSANSLRLY